MKPAVYGLGMLLLIVGAASGVAEVLLFALAEGGHRSLALGTLWYRVHANSLLGLRATIEGFLAPVLGTPLTYVLSLPAWLAFAAPGLAVLLLARRERERSRHF